MKIFLNERTIEFIPVLPQQTIVTVLVTEYSTPEALKLSWEDFCRYEKYKRMLIVDPEYSLMVQSPAFISFVKLFKYVPAAGGLVKNENGAFLFIHRLGFWDLPKGKIEKSDVTGRECTVHDTESARIAAIREVKEETGLKKLDIGTELSPTWHIYFAKEKYHLKKTRWFEMQSDSKQVLKPATKEGIFLVKWTPPENIHCILTHTYASIRELLLDLVF
jgi:8-oxo-dGTP pyrophosphatase MutT (NUDIX family)